MNCDFGPACKLRSSLSIPPSTSGFQAREVLHSFCSARLSLASGIEIVINYAHINGMRPGPLNNIEITSYLGTVREISEISDLDANEAEGFLDLLLESQVGPLSHGDKLWLDAYTQKFLNTDRRTVEEGKGKLPEL